MNENEEPGKVWYCVVCLENGNITYHGRSLASAARFFDPGTVAAAASSPEAAVDLGILIAVDVRARQARSMRTSDSEGLTCWTAKVSTWAACVRQA
jgi:hypothetical protein